MAIAQTSVQILSDGCKSWELGFYRIGVFEAVVFDEPGSVVGVHITAIVSVCLRCGECVPIPDDDEPFFRACEGDIETSGANVGEGQEARSAFLVGADE